MACSEAESRVVRQGMLSSKKRIDGRAMDEVREISVEVGFLPSVHGSALFNRGETQALATVTLCNAGDAQIVDTTEGVSKQRFMLHYNFPPYSVGEAGRMGSVGRREVGHGNLAWKALNPVLPGENLCPYAIRTVSEVLGSNGSSSMATVCGISMALMHAGVQTKAPVAGVAMGLIKEGDSVAVLTDILGDEDHLGDMDFKVAGTQQGVTALQMDLKIPFVSESILKEALQDALKARLSILKIMNQTVPAVCKQMHATAPAIRTMQVNPKFIGRIIGSGGRTIKGLTDEHGVQIDISDEGTVQISGPKQANVTSALEAVEALVYQPSVGDKGQAVVRCIKNKKVLVEMKGQYGILTEDVNAFPQVKEGELFDVEIERVERDGEKVFFKVLR